MGVTKKRAIIKVEATLNWCHTQKVYGARAIASIKKLDEYAELVGIPKTALILEVRENQKSDKLY